MIRILGSLVIFLFISIILGCQSSPQQDTNQLAPTVEPLPPQYKILKIAVLALPSREFPHTKVENIAMEALINKGYHISSRGDLERVLDEQKIQRSQITETTAAELGKVLNVDAIFIFELTDLKFDHDPNRGRHISHVSMVGRLVNVEDGRVIWIENISTQQDNLITSLLNLPMAILTMNPNEDRIEKKVNEILKKFPIVTLGL